MKKPFVIYFLVIVYAGIFLLLGGFLASGLAHILSPLPKLQLLWNSIFPNSGARVVTAVICALLAVLAYGLWRGRPWARNLSLVVNIIFVINMVISLLPNFTILKLDDLKGWPRAVAYFELMFLGWFFLMFLITLRPEVGRFCKVYPEKSIRV